MKNKTRVLLGSPIRQKADILQHFLQSIRQLNCGGMYELDYFFVDDNLEEESSQLLSDFSTQNHNTSIMRTRHDKPYICNESTHIWEEELIWKVAGFKNIMINLARKEGYDFLFLLDSDIVLHPQTLIHLLGLKKDIVAEIFWTRWEADLPELPQVWVGDQYNLYESTVEENLTQNEIFQRVQLFINKLKVPGVYKVGGLGACTLISRKALQSGVNFNQIYNISFIGEDRHFCIRAVALGFELFVDTHYPAFHIYRPVDLNRLEEYKAGHEQ
ncbi:MAG: glycosyl transferase family protein [Firmicutes bacterium]|nr:glycosyl transferase family protein [Bacillota bacterium]